jgi:putative DNA topoisomerase
VSKIDNTLFSAHSQALADAHGDCPECQSALVIRHSKSGPFIGCANYPTCTFSKPLHETGIQTIKVMGDSCCPECSDLLAIKKGRYGLFIGCTNAPDCHYIESLKPQEKTAVGCPSCGKGDLVHKINRFGKPFWSCNQYPRCKYIVNQEPQSVLCQQCGWSIMLSDGNSLKCPQPNCGNEQSNSK